MKAARTAVALVLWFAAFWWFWMLLVGEWNLDEVIAASCVAALTAPAAELARAKGMGRLRVPARWVWRAKSVPPVILVDFAIITWALLKALARGRRVHGTFRVKPYAPEGGAEQAAAIRAWVTYAAMFSPNAYVIDMDPERGETLLHDIVPRESSEEPA
jgi:hypothetical protein